MIIRTATLADLPQIFEIGAKCYPAEEALTQEEYRGRLLVYPHHFWLLEKDQEIRMLKEALARRQSKA